MKYLVEVAGRSVEVEVDGTRVLVGGRVQPAQLSGRPGEAVRRLVRPRAARSFVVAPGEGRGAWLLAADGERLALTVLDPRDQALRAAGARSAVRGPGIIKAPMPGMVLRLLVAEGDRVVLGQGLVVIEAMKMENELKAPREGTVQRVHAVAGTPVEKGVPLVEIV